MKIQVVKHIEILIINVEIYSEKPNNDLQFWVFEEDQKIPTSPRIIFFQHSRYPSCTADLTVL